MMQWRSERMLVAPVAQELAGDVARSLRSALAVERCDVVATLCEVALIGESGMTAQRATMLESTLQEALRSAEQTGPASGRIVTLPVCYEGDCAPDADHVAHTCGLAKGDIARLHAGREYTAGFVGFSPGFAYLQGVDERLRLGRMATPRPRVPQGSVAIAGEQTAVYPAATPGGWHIIGRTPVRVFDAHRQPPAMIEAGDRVRFEPISREQYEVMLEHDQSRPSPAINRPALRVEHPGSLASVQDAGRSGFMHAGVSASGSADWLSRVVANRLVGNADDAAIIEASLSGPTLLALHDITLAVCGAHAAMVLEQTSGRLVEVPTMTPLSLHVGERLRVRGYRAGSRIAIAVAGGIVAPRTLGSCSVHVTTRLGGRPLLAGDELATGERLSPPARAGAALKAWMDHALSRRTLRVTLHPHAKLLGDLLVQRFEASLWQVASRSDRAGLRLDGASLAHTLSAMPSHATLAGDIEVTPDGSLVTLGPDGPVTGGYPVIASVIAADLPALMQARPRDWLRLTVVSIAQAREATRELRATLDEHLPPGEPPCSP